MDMMLTTKTLGRDAGCIVMSIGAVMFDRSGLDRDASLRPENKLHIPISSFDSGALGLKTSADTLKWWRKQEAWPQIASEFMHSNTTVSSACKQFAEFYEHHRPKKVWCNSPTFHIPILTHLFQLSGQRFPVDFHDEADHRTILDLAYPERSERPVPHRQHGFFAHHALGDALTQSTALTTALDDLRRDPSELIERQRYAMLDIETLGRKVGCGMLSIGASMFNAGGSVDLMTHQGNQFYVAINNFDVLNHGFHTDPDTLAWWRDKPIWKDLSAEVASSKIGIVQACNNLAAWLKETKPDKIWANAPSFDIEILRYAFRKLGLDLPVHYQQEMDYRTVMETVYPERAQRPDRIFKTFPNQHHAQGDAIEQSLQASRALQGLGLAPRGQLKQVDLRRLADTVVNNSPRAKLDEQHALDRAQAAVRPPRRAPRP